MKNVPLECDFVRLNVSFNTLKLCLQYIYKVISYLFFPIIAACNGKPNAIKSEL